ncbi:MAG: hypothetical protein K1W01_02810 [Muribaculaceae bacterium]
MKKLIILLVVVISSVMSSTAQVFYHRIDVTTGNLYSFVASNLISAGLNYISQDRLLDTSFGYTVYDSSYPGATIKMKDYSRTGITMRDLIADSSYGVKLGYQSFYPGVFNWGIYGSAHYKINRFKMEYSDLLMPQNIHRLQLGGGILLSFGSIDSAAKAVIEAGIRYNLPVRYKGSWGVDAGSVLEKGITNHYSIRFGGFGVLQGVGLFAEIPLYNLVKSNAIFPGLKFKPYTFGITYTIMPWN